MRLGFVATYIGLVGALLVYSNLVSPCGKPFPIAREWVMLGLLAGMLLVERFEVTRPAARLLARMAISLLILRVRSSCRDRLGRLHPPVPRCSTR